MEVKKYSAISDILRRICLGVVTYGALTDFSDKCTHYGAFTLFLKFSNAVM